MLMPLFPPFFWTGSCSVRHVQKAAMETSFRRARRSPSLTRRGSALGGGRAPSRGHSLLLRQPGGRPERAGSAPGGNTSVTKNRLQTKESSPLLLPSCFPLVLIPLRAKKAGRQEEQASPAQWHRGNRAWFSDEFQLIKKETTATPLPSGVRTPNTRRTTCPLLSVYLNGEANLNAVFLLRG